jgi:hypothetical protein
MATPSLVPRQLKKAPAAGTKTVPLPTATQFQPLRGCGGDPTGRKRAALR